MVTLLQAITLALVAVAMALSLAHALELPGKMRLSKDLYFAVQRIYYPGFTIGGVSEPASLISSLVLLYITPRDTAAFWLTLGALVRPRRDAGRVLDRRTSREQDLDAR
ncbi:MAG TPA: hypothetical protein VGL25_11850 [Casimicrobiaceae bacterium]